MINPEEFINIKKDTDKYESFKKMDSSYMCQEVGCHKYSNKTYHDPKEGVMIWVCPDGHENKAKARFE
jgi:hypothetical protein